jgi:hypothetical protein
MTKSKNPHAVALGATKSKKKAAAARRNGKLGGIGKAKLSRKRRSEIARNAALARHAKK